MTNATTKSDLNSFTPPSNDTCQRFREVVGERYALNKPEDIAPFVVEPRELFVGLTPLVLLPGSTDEVAKIMAIANETHTPIVPQSGNTGLVGGQTPFRSGCEIILSLSRLNRIREIDVQSNAIVAEAGVILRNLQLAAENADRLFPLSLGAEGSCQIGGNLATNAGGIAVLAYGNMRELTYGLEVVLADGRIWNGLKRLRKDNTGYSLKDMFVGSEGTLGIITAATLKIFPRPRTTMTALIAVPDVTSAVEILHRLQSGGGLLTSCELLPRIGIEFVLNHRPSERDPLETPSPWYVLAELSSTQACAALDDIMETILESAIEDHVATDAMIAQSLSQAQNLWRLRHLVVEVQRDEGGSIKHDVSVPVARIPQFIEEASEAVTRVVPGARPVPFGHIGDGNIHFNVTQPPDMDRDSYLAYWDEMNAVVHRIVASMLGSISAEHGIGRIKRDALALTADPVGMEMMQSLKLTFDPNGILNPGKVLAASSRS